MPAAEDIQRQIAIAVVIAVEEPAFLMPVQWVIGGIEIERDLRRGFGVGIEEQIDEQGLDGGCIGGNPGIAGWLGAAEFKPVQCAFAGQRGAVLARGRQLARQGRQHRVVAELVMVVEVFVAEREADNPLHHQRLDRMLGVGGMAVVAEAGRQATSQAKHPVRRSQQQGASVTGDGATIKGCNDRTPVSTCKLKSFQATLCRHRGLPLLGR